MPQLLQIEIGLHYCCTGNSDYRDGDLSAPAVYQEIDNFVELGLLERGTEVGKPRYRATDGMRCWMEALKAVPLPKKEWVISHPADQIEQDTP